MKQVLGESARGVCAVIFHDGATGALPGRFSRSPGERPRDAQVPGRHDDAGTSTPIRISVRDGARFREIDDREPVRLVHAANNVFQYESNPGLRMAFDTSRDGVRRLTIRHASEAPPSALRSPEAPGHAAFLATLEGRFTNAGTGARFELRMNPKGPSLISLGDVTWAKIRLRDRLDGFGYRFTAIRDGEDRVEGLMLDGQRMRRVWIARD